MIVAGFRRLSLVLAVLGVVLCLATPAEPAVLYNVVDLGTLGGSSDALGVNDSGAVTGQSRKQVGASAQYRAFQYTSGPMQDIGPFSDGVWSMGKDINSSGAIVGHGDTLEGGSGTTHAFIYSGGTKTDLGTLGSRYSYAYGVNDSGVVVGNARVVAGSGHSYHAFRYDSAAATPAMEDIGTLSSANYSRAWDINDSGIIVGDSKAIGGSDHAVRWNAEGGIDDLGTLGDGARSYARGISDSGIVVGYSEFASGNNDVHAFRYVGASMIDLGTLGGDESYAYGANDAGNVVGMAYTGTGTQHAFLHDGTSMLDLNDLIAPDSGWVLSGARDINSNGWIVGYGRMDGFGSSRAFLLTPVPEPSTCVLTLSGLLIGALLYRRRRRNP